MLPPVSMPWLKQLPLPGMLSPALPTQLTPFVFTVSSGAMFSGEPLTLLPEKLGCMLTFVLFSIWALEKTLKSPLDSKEILKEINPEYSLEGLMLKLKLQYFGHLMGRANSLGKILMKA